MHVGQPWSSPWIYSFHRHHIAKNKNQQQICHFVFFSKNQRISIKNFWRNVKIFINFCYENSCYNWNCCCCCVFWAMKAFYHEYFMSLKMKIAERPTLVRLNFRKSSYMPQKLSIQTSSFFITPPHNTSPTWQKTPKAATILFD